MFHKIAIAIGGTFLFSLLQTTPLVGNLYQRSNILTICWSLGRGIDEARARWGFRVAKEEGIGMVRVYDSMPTPPNFLQIAQEQGVRVTMGAWLGTNSEENAEQLDMLRKAITDGLVEPTAIVGNEALLNKYVTVDQLIGYLEETKQNLPESVAVTTAETDDVLINNPRLIDALRHIVGLIYYPFAHWVSIDDAFADFVEHYNKIKALSGDKKVVVYETGWPSCGLPYGKAVPSIKNQKRYNREVAQWALANHVEVHFFQLIDEPWKAEFSDEYHTHEACWGLRHEDGSPKY